MLHAVASASKKHVLHVAAQLACMGSAPALQKSLCFCTCLAVLALLLARPQPAEASLADAQAFASSFTGDKHPGDAARTSGGTHGSDGAPVESTVLPTSLGQSTSELIDSTAKDDSESGAEAALHEEGQLPAYTRNAAAESSIDAASAASTSTVASPSGSHNDAQSCINMDEAVRPPHVPADGGDAGGAAQAAAVLSTPPAEPSSHEAPHGASDTVTAPSTDQPSHPALDDAPEAGEQQPPVPEGPALFPTEKDEPRSSGGAAPAQEREPTPLDSQSYSMAEQQLELEDLGRRINLAAAADGASVMAHNPEARRVERSIDGDEDSFMKNDCSARKWLMLELSQVSWQRVPHIAGNPDPYPSAQGITSSDIPFTAIADPAFHGKIILAC